MKRVVRMRDGRIEIISSPEDFELLVYTYMGPDCRELYHSQIETLSDCIKESEYWDINARDDILRQYGYE